MSDKKLAVLGVVAVIMVCLAVLQTRLSRAPSRKAFAGSHLIQGLDPDSITSIAIGMGNNAVRLVRVGNRFIVSNKDNYPAETKKINDLITSCMDVRTTELITSDSTNYADLEVSETNAKGLVKFLGADGKVITGVVVGKTDSQTNSTYIRSVSGQEVYTTSNPPSVKSTALDYVDKEIVNIEREKVALAIITSPTGSYTLRIGDSNEGEVVLVDLPEGKKLKDSDAKDVLGALSYLSFEDVYKESSGMAALIFDSTYVAETTDTTLYTFELAEADGKTYVRCSAAYPKILELDKGDMEGSEAKYLARDDAIIFTARHAGWVYEVSEWKAKNLAKKLDDLVEDIETETASDANDASAAGATEEVGAKVGAVQ